jgi:hypothetical protein
MATNGLYHTEIEEITNLLRALNAHSEHAYITIGDEKAHVPITVERGEHGKAIAAGWLEFNGNEWTFVAAVVK